MKLEHIAYMVCLACEGELTVSEKTKSDAKQLLEGILTCMACRVAYPVRGGIPRFIPRTQHYTQAFGLEWSKHARTQFDSYTGLPLSEKRFFKETRWPRNMAGEVILEAGCGSGRFTEQALRTGAMVVSFDASMSVEENYGAHGDNDRLLVVQADISAMPFRKHFFDRLFCIGVLQHTPNPGKTFYGLTEFVKPSGYLAVDVYRRHPWWRQMWNTRYWVRPITRRMNPERLYHWCEWYIHTVWPFVKLIHRLPFGTTINGKLLVPEFLGSYTFSEHHQRAWALLHLFDWLSPRHDNPQTIPIVQQWFKDAGLEEIEVHFGYGGIEGRGRAPVT